MPDTQTDPWDDNPVDISTEANFIWEIANKLRGAYMPDKYGDVIIPMTIIRRFECALEPTKKAVVAQFNENPNYPMKAMLRVSGYPFFNTSSFSLKELCNDPDHIAANFREYLLGFSMNVQDILQNLNMDDHIGKMNSEGCLYSVVKAFSDLDLSIERFDSIKMGYIFENLIGRFFQNVDAGQFYTGRDIIKLLVSLLTAEGCDDIFDQQKVITVCDQACGTGGMLTTAYSYLKHLNPTADVRLFGQEYMGQSYAVGLAEMLIKGQNAENFRHVDTFKVDCFPDVKMRFVIENPPFGTPWGGKNAKEGQETAVKQEAAKGECGRWGAGLPGTGDAQLLFLQSAVAKMDDELGRAAIIENGSPLFTGGTASGESQIRRWLLEKDLIEAIIAMPTDLFYNTSIATYVWILSKNKRAERKGKVQLIDASQIYHKLRKPLGNKRNEFLREDREEITSVYSDFEENEICKIFPNTEFIYREYTIKQPLRRSYGITEDRIERMLQYGALKTLWDEEKVGELELKGTKVTAKEREEFEKFMKTRVEYEKILESLRKGISDKKWFSPDSFEPDLRKILGIYIQDKTFDKLFSKIMDGLSVYDKDGVVQVCMKGKNKGQILYDDRTKDTELVRWDESIEEYMAREVIPHIPDAKWFWEEDLAAKKPVIKTGAEIPFTRYFYKYQQPKSSKVLADRFIELEKNLEERIKQFTETVTKGLEKNTTMKESRIFYMTPYNQKWRLSKIGYECVKLSRSFQADDVPLLCTNKGKVSIRPEEMSGKMVSEDNAMQGIHKGDIAIHGMDTWHGAIALSEYNGKITRVVHVCDSDNDRRFIVYYLQQLAFNGVYKIISNGVRENTSDFRSWDKVANIYIALPEKYEQSAICDYLDSMCSHVEEIIRMKKQQLSVLEDYRKSLIYEYITGKKEVPVSV